MPSDSDNPVVIFETVHGSTAFGLARAGSDVDVKGIIVGPLRWYFGSATAPEQLQITDDHVRFEVRKVFRLAIAANPTVLELLFTDEQHHLTVSDAGRMLLQHREAFLTTQVADRFGGYAMAQLKRIRTHRAHLLNPTTSPSIQRNALRSELEARFGYDTKHAMHLIRLQRMGIEILRGHGVQVTRSDREELWAIRDGAWTFEELEAQAERGNAQLREAATKSALPSRANEDLLDDLCIEIIRRTIAP